MSREDGCCLDSGAQSYDREWINRLLVSSAAEMDGSTSFRNNLKRARALHCLHGRRQHVATAPRWKFVVMLFVRALDLVEVL